MAPIHRQAKDRSRYLYDHDPLQERNPKVANKSTFQAPDEANMEKGG